MITDTRGAMTIGRLAAAAGCNLETVRYYERVGLMKPPPRTRGGHRLYGGDAVGRLTFIRRARELGFTIGDIRALLGLADRRAVTCGPVRKITEHQRRGVRATIADLRKLDRVLAGMARSCAGGDVPDCPVIEALLSSKAA
ncbi:MAG: MerR family transcriptional regulator [Rhodospirillales bacterium]